MLSPTYTPPCSGTLRTGTSSCVRTVRYHTTAIAVSDFTIATRKWAKLNLCQMICHVLRLCVCVCVHVTDHEPVNYTVEYNII